MIMKTMMLQYSRTYRGNFYIILSFSCFGAPSGLYSIIHLCLDPASSFLGMSLVMFSRWMRIKGQIFRVARSAIYFRVTSYLSVRVPHPLLQMRMLERGTTGTWHPCQNQIRRDLLLTSGIHQRFHREL